MRFFLAWLPWAFTWALIGSFGTAYLHEKTGRDVTAGGIIGALVGAIGGIILLVFLGLWVYYGMGGGRSPVYRVYNVPRKPWYRWWDK